MFIKYSLSPFQLGSCLHLTTKTTLILYMKDLLNLMANFHSQSFSSLTSLTTLISSKHTTTPSLLPRFHIHLIFSFLLTFLTAPSPSRLLVPVHLPDKYWCAHVQCLDFFSFSPNYYIQCENSRIYSSISISPLNHKLICPISISMSNRTEHIPN